MRTFALRGVKRVTHLSFSRDGTRLAALTSKAEDHVGSAVWVDAVTGEPERTIPLDATRGAIAPGHDWLAVGYSPYARPDGASEVRWSDLRAGGDLGSWNDVRGLPHHHIFALAFTPDGTGLAVGCSGQQTHNHPWEHAIHLMPLAGGPATTVPVEDAAGALAFSPDGRWLAVCGGPGGDPQVRFRDIATGEWSGEYTPKATRTRRLAFAPDRAELVALAAKKAVLLGPGRSAPRAVLEGHTAAVADAVYTPDGRRIITVAGDATARLWNARGGALLRTFTWPVGKLSAVAVAPDGLTAVAAGEKGQIVVWDIED